MQGLKTDRSSSASQHLPTSGYLLWNCPQQVDSGSMLTKDSAASPWVCPRGFPDWGSIVDAGTLACILAMYSLSLGFA